MGEVICSVKWSEITCPEREKAHGVYDENEKTARGWFLHTIGIDLENIPEELFEPCEWLDIDGMRLSKPYEARVDIRDVFGTKRNDYAGKTWIDAFCREHKVLLHIRAGHVTRGKYFNMLKKHIEDQEPWVTLIKSKNGGYYVYRNGNHRITFYKLMYLADLANFGHGTNKYWLYAEVYDEL